MSNYVWNYAFQVVSQNDYSKKKKKAHCEAAGDCGLEFLMRKRCSPFFQAKPALYAEWGLAGFLVQVSYRKAIVGERRAINVEVLKNHLTLSGPRKPKSQVSNNSC